MRQSPRGRRFLASLHISKSRFHALGFATSGTETSYLGLWLILATSWIGDRNAVPNQLLAVEFLIAPEGEAHEAVVKWGREGAPAGLAADIAALNIGNESRTLYHQYEI